MLRYQVEVTFKESTLGGLPHTSTTFRTYLEAADFLSMIGRVVLFLQSGLAPASGVERLYVLDVTAPAAAADVEEPAAAAVASNARAIESIAAFNRVLSNEFDGVREATVEASMVPAAEEGSASDADPVVGGGARAPRRHGRRRAS